MLKLSFHGASGTVTGSCFMLTSNFSKVLIDCGLFQGGPELEKLNHAAFGFNPQEIDGLLLTHAHLDHCGRLGKLVKEGFNGPIYLTAATRDLLQIALEDAAHVMEEHKEVPPLYDADDVANVLSLCKIIACNKPFDFAGYNIKYVNAGHILGSASIIVKGNGKTIAFSGDLGNSPEDLIQPTEYISEADIVVMESTYGDRNHPDEDPSDILAKEIEAVEGNGGTLLIPAFSIERSQEILHKIDHLKKKGLVKEQTQFYLDSPMAIKVTDVFRKFTELYNSEMANHIKSDDPFSFAGLQVIYRGKDSISLKDTVGTQVIIAGSGMMTGGRILNHAVNFLPRPSTRLLIVGFQAEHTIGRQISEGAKVVDIYGQSVKVNAHVSESHAMSSHADQTGLLKWFRSIGGISKLFLIHGEDGPRAVLKEKILRERQNLEIHTPHLGEAVEV